MRLFSAGSNSHGQCGTGNTIDSEEFNRIPFSHDSAVRSVEIAGGGYHTLICIDKQILYGCGGNDYGQLVNLRSENVSLFTKIDHSMGRIQQIACGWNHTLVLSNNGIVYAYGNNSFGQLGISISSNTPKNQIENVSRFKKVAAGLRHSLAITQSGTLFGWGDNKKGKLHRSSESFFDRPIQIDYQAEKSHVIDICCGQNFSCVLTSDFCITIIGDTKWFGETSSYGIFTQFLSVDKEYKKVSLKAGFNHLMVLLEYSDKSTQLFGLGRNDYGQLGHPLGNDVKVASIEVGAEHSLFLDADHNKLCACGMNEHGNLGISPSNAVLCWTAVKTDVKVDFFGCGYGCTIVGSFE